MRTHEKRNRRIDARDLFDDDGAADRVVAGPAVLLGHHDAEQPLLGELRDQLRRKTRRIIALGRPGRDLADSELAHRVFQNLLIVAQFKMHSYSGCWLLALGFGLWALGFGLWALGSGLWALGSGLWALGSGLWTTGYCPLPSAFRLPPSAFRLPPTAYR